jgi:putative ABC transport system permease protein
MGIRRKVGSWFPWYRRQAREADLERELRDHLDLEAEEQQDAGLSAEEASYAARRVLGNTLQIKEDVRMVWGLQWLEMLLQDLGYGFRQLLRNPGFTVVAVLTLALGIGANTAIFSVVNAVLLRPLPYADPAQLMLVNTGKFSKGLVGTSPPDFRTLRERNRSFENLSAFYGAAFTLTGNQQAERLEGDIVSSEFFSTLGVRPLLGRTFLRSEEQWGSHHVVMVSEPFWRTHFAASPNPAGAILRLDGEEYTVVGVMPPNFYCFSRKELWAPMAWAPGDVMNSHNNYFLSMVGRLRHGVTRQQAFADLNGVMAGIAREFPENKGIGADLQPLGDALVSDVRLALLVLFGAVGFLLLIACANIANLLLARGVGRQKEIAIRSALGAGRARLLRQFITESVLLAMGGGAIGLALPYLSLKVLPLAASSLPRYQEVSVDGWVIAFTFAVAMVTGMLFGCGPVLQKSPTDLNARLKEGGRVAGVGIRGGKLRAGLVISEVALSLILLFGAALMIQSFEHLLRVDTGFDPRNVLTFEIDMPKSVEAGMDPFENGAPPRMASFFSQLLSRVESLPGVRAAGVTSALPLQGENWTKYISFADRPAPPSLDQVAQVQYRSVAGEYFRVMGIPLLKGRLFNEADGNEGPLVVIVSKALARRFWPNENAVGKVVWMAPPESLLPPGAIPKGYHIPRETVVGVVDDVRYGALDKDPLPVAYQPMTQGDHLLSMFVTIRTQGDPKAMVPSVRQALSEVDKNQPMANVRTMEEIRADSANQPRLESFLLGLFGGLGLALSAVGIYGVMSNSVARQTHDIAIRMALGAKQTDVIKMVVQQGMKLAAAGVALGVMASLILARLMASLLYGVKPTDPLTLALVCVGLGCVALLAGYIPAQRAAKIDPMVALRQD